MQILYGETHRQVTDCEPLYYDIIQSCVNLI